MNCRRMLLAPIAIILVSRELQPDGKFVGDAAESGQVSPDHLTDSFTRGPNVLFHEGSKVDAAAVKFGIERLLVDLT